MGNVRTNFVFDSKSVEYYAIVCCVAFIKSPTAMLLVCVALERKYKCVKHKQQINTLKSISSVPLSFSVTPCCLISSASTHRHASFFFRNRGDGGILHTYLMTCTTNIFLVVKMRNAHRLTLSLGTQGNRTVCLLCDIYYLFVGT